MRTARASLHVEPRGAVATARHYLRDLVYGSSDGIITTFAVVAGVAGGDLPSAAVLIVGVANLAADGVSMGVGNLQAIRAYESARAAQDLPEEEAYPWKHGIATLASFVAAGAVPLLPYVAPLPADDERALRRGGGAIVRHGGTLVACGGRDAWARRGGGRSRILRGRTDRTRAALTCHLVPSRSGAAPDRAARPVADCTGRASTHERRRREPDPEHR
jgi:hypothetical protein